MDMLQAAATSQQAQLGGQQCAGLLECLLRSFRSADLGHQAVPSLNSHTTFRDRPAWEV